MDYILDDCSPLIAAVSEIKYCDILEMAIIVLLYNKTSVSANYVVSIQDENNELPFYNLIYALQKAWQKGQHVVRTCTELVECTGKR